MGEGTDKVDPRTGGTQTPFERSQDAAAQNEEAMRERLGAPPDVYFGPANASVAPGATSLSREGDAIERIDSARAGTTDLDAADIDRTDVTSADESTAELRSDIVDTRERMGSTIDEIQERLSPHNLVGQAKEAARDATIGRAQEMASNVADSTREARMTLMDTIRDNPVPVAITAIGLGWLIFSGRREAAHRHDRSYRYGNYSRTGGNSGYGGYGRYGRYDPRDMRAGEYRQSQQSMGDWVQDTAGNVAGKVSNKAGEMADTVSDKAGDVADYAQWQAQRTRGWLEQTWNDNPLLVAGAAIALGIVVGLALPETEKENELMGEVRDSLVQRAQGVAQQTVQRAQSAATDATDQMRQQAQQAQQAQQTDQASSQRTTRPQRGSGTAH